MEGWVHSAFVMTEPAAEGGAGRPDGDQRVINGRKAFATRVDGAQVGIVMAKLRRRNLRCEFAEMTNLVSTCGTLSGL